MTLYRHLPGWTKVTAALFISRLDPHSLLDLISTPYVRTPIFCFQVCLQCKPKGLHPSITVNSARRIDRETGKGVT